MRGRRSGSGAGRGAGRALRNWTARHRIKVAAAVTGVGALVSGIAGADEVTGLVIWQSVGTAVLAAFGVALIDGQLREAAGGRRSADRGAASPNRPGDPPRTSGRGRPGRRRVGFGRWWRRRRAPVGRQPQELSTFRGRGTELAALRAEHERQRRDRMAGSARMAGQPPGPGSGTGAVLLLIHGKPGVGKSVLAQKLAAELAVDYPDGVVYAHLGTAGAARSPAEILKAFLDELHWPEEEMPRDLTERAEVFRTVTADRRMLFILDAARHHDQVRQVLPTNPRCAVIVTSRRDLGPALNVPSLQLDVPPLDEALEMLGAAAGIDPVTRPECATEIVDMCGRLPMAIRSAGEWVSLDGSDLCHVADLLRERRTRLTWLGRGGRSPWERISTEYRRLLPREQRALSLLTLVSSPTFVPWVLRPLLGVSLAEAENLVAQLCTAQLLDEAGGDEVTRLSRYRFNPLVRLFAAERLAEQPPEVVAAARTNLYAAYREAVIRVLRVLDPASAEALSPIPLRWFPDDPDLEARLADAAESWTRAEYGNLRRTVLLAFEAGEWELCWRLAARLGGCVADGEDIEAVRQVFQRAVTAAGNCGEPLGEVDVLIAEGSFLVAVERYGAAFHVLRLAEEKTEKLLDRLDAELAEPVREHVRRLAGVSQRRGEAYLQMGDYRRADGELKRASVLAQRADDGTAVRLIRLLLAETHHVLSPDPSYGEVLDGKLDDATKFRAYLGMAESARRRGDYEGASDELQRALLLSRGDTRRVAAVQYRLARLHLDRWRDTSGEEGIPNSAPDGAPPVDPGQLEVARSCARQAVGRAAEAALIFRRMGNQVGLIRSHCLLARALVAVGQVLEAEHLCQIADRELAGLSAAGDSAVPPLQARLRLAQGEALLCRGAVAAGWATLVEAALLFTGCGDWAGRSRVITLLRAAERRFAYPKEVPGAQLTPQPLTSPIALTIP